METSAYDTSKPYNSSDSDSAIIATIGFRLTQRRVEMGLTQATLAEKSGVSKRTIENLENGVATNVTNLIKILRVLGFLEGVMKAIPEPGISPILMHRLQGKPRKRASKSMIAHEAKPRWRWGDEK